MGKEFSHSHFKMYKKGKNWVYTSLSVITVMGIGMSSSGVVTANADDTPVQTVVKDSDKNIDTTSSPSTKDSSKDDTQQVHLDEKNNTESKKEEVKQNITEENSTHSEVGKGLNADNGAPASVINKDNEDKFEKTATYLTKGAHVFADVQGDAVLYTVSDYNTPATVEAKNISNGRVPVLSNNKPAGYIETTNTSVNPLDFNDDYGFSHFTRQHMDSVIANHPQSQEVPLLGSDQVKNISSIGNKDTWDSWPLTNPDGTVANYHGYHVLFALCGEPFEFEDTDIYMFYQKIGTQNQGVDSWKFAGKVFDNFQEGTSSDQDIIHQSSQNWSGSTVLLNPDANDMRMFYTTVKMDAVPPVMDRYPRQYLATANLKVLSTDEGLTIDHSSTSDRKVIFTGDGAMYQDFSQFIQDSNQTEINLANNEAALRDPHFVFHDGKYYLTFEANTGYESGLQGLNNLYNMAYYGGTYEQNKVVQQALLKDNHLAEMVKENNNVLGLVELDDSFNIKSIKKPLIGANGTSDEIERPSLFQHRGKWYLFGVVRDLKFPSPEADQSNEHLLGFVSDNFDGPFKPLNGNGSVLQQNLGQRDPNYTYSYLVLNNGNDDSDEFVVVSYVHKRFNFNNNSTRATFSPNFLIRIDGDTTSVIDTHALPQGGLVDDGSGYIKIKPATHQIPNRSSAIISCISPIPVIPPVTPDVPPVTPNVPPVTPNVPPVTPDVPPVTPNVPPVTPDVPPVTPPATPDIPELPKTDKSSENSFKLLTLSVASVLGAIGVSRHRRKH